MGQLPSTWNKIEIIRLTLFAFSYQGTLMPMRRTTDEKKGGSLHDKKSLEYQEKSNIRNIEYTSLLTRGANRANALPISQKKCPPHPLEKNPNNAKYVSFGLFWMLRSPRVIKPSPGVTVGGNERKKTRERAGQFFLHVHSCTRLLRPWALNH